MVRISKSTKPFAMLAAAMQLGAALTVEATTINKTQPDFDRWNYPFNASNGTRGTAPTFGAFNSTFDNRDAGFLIGFNLAAQLPTLNSGESFLITSLTITATHSTGSFLFDPTYDGYRTYLDPSDPNYQADSDAGRPIVLTGAGLKSTVGYTAFSFMDFNPNSPPFYGENEVYGLGNPTFKYTRSAFPYDPNSTGFNVFGNVSNNVDEGFDFTPWAIGQAGVNPGDPVAEAVPGSSPGETFTFTLNTADAGIQAYLQDGLEAGSLFFMITSLHSAAQLAGGANPNFYTRDNFDPASVPATLTLTFDVIPEPSTALMAGGALAWLAARMRRRAQRRLS